MLLTVEVAVYKKTFKVVVELPKLVMVVVAMLGAVVIVVDVLGGC